MIVDENDQPISGAAVEISVPATESSVRIHFSMFSETTDAQGRWEFDAAPKEHGKMIATVEREISISENEAKENKTTDLGILPVDEH